MAYKPTGKPVGRPKTKEYVTLLARVPVELAELVKQYAGQHGQSVAELIRDGIEWRIGDGDPRGNGLYLAQPASQSEKMYYTNTETALGSESGDLLREIRAELVRQREQLQAVMQAVEQHTSSTESGQSPGRPGNSNVSDFDGDIPEASVKAQSMLGHVPGSEQKDQEAEGFDPAKFTLGRLCKGAHEYMNTGQTLYRLPKFVCPKCDAEKARERRARKRQAVSTSRTREV